MCHANIRSLKHKDLETGLLDRFLHIKCNLAGTFDIITLSETWLASSDSSDEFRLTGYQAPFRRDRDYGVLGYGGVLAWVSNDIACKRRKDFELPEMETLWLECRSNNNKFFLCVIYRTASNSDISFWDKLQENINYVLENGYKKILITGDLNSHPGTHDGVKLYDFVEANQLTIHINQPTRITSTSEKVLDQFISNMPHMIKSTSIQPPVSTNNHCTVVANLLFRTKKSKVYKRKMWNFKNANFDVYRQALNVVNWEECFVDQSDINIVANLWTSKLLSAAESSIPNKNVTVRPNDKPWYRNYLRTLCRKKNRIHKKAKISKQENDWDAFKLARNDYFSEIKRAKIAYDQGKFEA